MGKTLETNKKILELLENKKMTITELSKELGLSKATVSQHIDELTRVHAVEKVDSEYFKKLKYYKTTPNYSAMFAKAIGVVIVLGIVAYAIYSYASIPLHSNTNNVSNKTGLITASVTTASYVNSSANATVTPGQISSAYSCIFLNYHMSGSIVSESGFSAYTLNYTVGNMTKNVTDYVISRGSSGSFRLAENITQTLSEPQGFNSTRTHYYLLRYNNSITSFQPTGVNITFSPKVFQAANGSINTTAYVRIAANATYGTYWINFDGPCGGGIGPELLTVGSKPYNGTLHEPVNIFG